MTIIVYKNKARVYVDYCMQEQKLGYMTIIVLKNKSYFIVNCIVHKNKSQINMRVYSLLEQRPEQHVRLPKLKYR